MYTIKWSRGLILVLSARLKFAAACIGSSRWSGGAPAPALRKWVDSHLNYCRLNYGTFELLFV